MITLRNTLLVAALTLLAPLAILAGEAHVSAADAVAAYAAIGDSLARDTTEDIAAHARKLQTFTAEYADLRPPLAVLADGKTDLAALRTAYKQLSAVFLPLARRVYTPAANDPNWAVMHCPMAEADWIQVDGKVANPYYGAKMLRCGTKTGDLAPAPAPEARHEAERGMSHGEQHEKTPGGQASHGSRPDRDSSRSGSR